jgi:hypothetical protein
MEEKLKKVLHHAKPLVMYKDYQDIKNGRYGVVAKRLKRRSFYLLLAGVFAGIVMFSNGLMYLVRNYMDSGLTELLLGLSWIALAVGFLYLMLYRRMKLRQTADWLIENNPEPNASLNNPG